MQCYPKGEPSLVVKSPRPFVPYQGYYQVIATFAVGTSYTYLGSPSLSTTEATFEVGIGTEALQAVQVIQVPEAAKPLVHVAPLGPSDPNTVS